MAKRFGGKYSPDGTGPDAPTDPRGAFDGARVDPTGARTNILFLPAIPLVFMSLNDGAIGLTLGPKPPITRAGLPAALRCRVRCWPAR